MLTFLKKLLREIFPPTVYGGGILVMLYTIFKDVRVGLLLFIAMIPQPNLWYKFHQYPLGNNFLDFLFIASVLGILLQKKRSGRLPNSLLLVLFIAINYLALINTSLNFHIPFPISGANRLLYDWKNYAQMILLYFVVAKTVESEEEAQTLMFVMTVVVLLVSYRAYKNFYAGDAFQYLKRAGGPFEVVGLGANHLGAFMGYSIAMISGLFLVDRRVKMRILYAVTVTFGMLALFFSYSRGAYLAVATVLVYFGARAKPVLLVGCLALFVTWKVVLPPSVVDRITMTRNQEGEVEASAAHRLSLWDQAMGQFKAHPFFGVGFGGFGFTVSDGELTDTHNVYMKMLSEQGLVGTVLLLIVLFRMFVSGHRLWKDAQSPFLQGLGLGMTGAVIACMVTNMFGDRWSYFVLGGYLWVWWGLVDRMRIQLCSNSEIEARQNA